MPSRKIIAALLVSVSLTLAGSAAAATPHKAQKPKAAAEKVSADKMVPAPAAQPEAQAPSRATANTAPESEKPVASPEAAAAAAMNPAPGQPAASAAGEEPELIHQDWPFQGAFGTYDRASLQRGFQVYKQVCSACHSMNLLSYRNLEDIGYTEGQVKAIAADYQVNDINDDTGEIYQRPAKPSDRFHAPFANKQASMAANNGAYPPDMSLLAKAREGGPDYIYSILTGFADFPPDVKHSSTQYYNKAMKGHIIAMPPPLVSDGQVQYENAPGVPLTVDQYARDVSEFLAWASEPHMEERKQTGAKVFLFLLVMCFVAWQAKKKVWSDVH